MATSQLELQVTSAAPQRRIVPLLAFAPISLLLSSGRVEADRAKLALLGTLLATFFLFAANTWFPGGANQFMLYADAIVHGSELPPGVASRDAGYPLLIILSGYTLLNSFIPLYLIQAGFSILLPVLIYEGLRRLSQTIAFFTGLASSVTLSPFYFMKMIHHDQTYIFFAILMLCLLVVFVQTKETRFLYFFTLAAICASVARPSGNALLPLFLIVGYVAARRSLKNCLACAAIFAVFLAGYGWHRHVIFGAIHPTLTASYLGEQLFYNPYINALDYGIRLKPEDIGPNFTLAIEQLRRRLAPNPQDSKFIQTEYKGPPDETAFAEAHIDPFTTDELIDRVLTEPNWEYYTLLCTANDDRTLLHATFEMARAEPTLILRYSMRNFAHFLFNPGYKHSRYNLNPFRPEGLYFYPATSNISGDILGLPAQAARELTLDVAPHEPFIFRGLFSVVQAIWTKTYETNVGIVAWLMSVAWLAAAASLVRTVRDRQTAAVAADSARLLGNSSALVASIVIASLVFGYNAAVTSIFAEPDFRYRQAADLQAIVIAGLGVIVLRRWFLVALGENLAARVVERWNDALHFTYDRDVWRGLTGAQLAMAVVGVAATGFAAWTLFMLVNTRP
jgi:hypothetical protein